MKYGVCLPNYGEVSSKDGLREVAIESEKLGYDSVWVTDHLLMPKQSETPYETIFETITSLAYIAAFTSRVKLGISSLVIALRNPLVVAKQLATVDVLSGGRVMLAVGAGWNEKEYAYLGSNFHDRGKRESDAIRLIRSLSNFSDDRSVNHASFEGKAIQNKFDVEANFKPRPIQKNRLKIWIAGVSRAAMKRATTLGDAWHPNVLPLEKFANLVKEFRETPGARSKEICVRIALNYSAPKSIFKGPTGEKRITLCASESENLQIMSELGKMGVTQMIVVPGADGKMAISDQIQSMRRFSEENHLD
ncbi:MAG: TIGR03619 family F420-dependent LLM class oxidoreductase [Rhabdochlamydiaceae bacterium]